MALDAFAIATRLAGAPAGDAWYLSAEATAVFKMLFSRPKDLLDIEKLVLVMGPDLDRAYVRRWLVEMMGEEDERVTAWDQIVRPRADGPGACGTPGR